MDLFVTPPHLLQKTHRFGVDASAAGPLGRRAAAADDAGVARSVLGAALDRRAADAGIAVAVDVVRAGDLLGPDMDARVP